MTGQRLQVTSNGAVLLLWILRLCFGGLFNREILHQERVISICEKKYALTREEDTEQLRRTVGILYYIQLLIFTPLEDFHFSRMTKI